MRVGITSAIALLATSAFGCLPGYVRGPGEDAFVAGVTTAGVGVVASSVEESARSAPPGNSGGEAYATHGGAGEQRYACVALGELRAVGATSAANARAAACPRDGACTCSANADFVCRTSAGAELVYAEAETTAERLCDGPAPCECTPRVVALATLATED